MKKNIIRFAMVCALLNSCESIDKVSPTSSVENIVESDTERLVSERVRKALADDIFLSDSAKNLKVSTHRGEVTLRGTVENEKERAQVIKKVSNIEGVTGMKDKTTLSSDPSIVEDIKSKASSAASSTASAVENVVENNTERSISQRVRQVIADDSSLSSNARNIKVSTSKGVVTLRGKIDSEKERGLITRKVNQVSGVERIEDKMSINAKGDISQSDSPSVGERIKSTVSSASNTVTSAMANLTENDQEYALSERVRQAIKNDPAFEKVASTIIVSTSDGVVTLRGILNNESEKNALLRKVKQTRGVQSVEDKITLKSDSTSMTESIKSKASAAAGAVASAPGTIASAVENLTENDEEYAISERVRQAIKSDSAFANVSSKIKVSTSEGVVTLRGTLNNENEKNILLRKVKQTRGVQSVEDKLSLKSDSISMTETIKSKASSAAGTVAATPGTVASAVENLTENDAEYALSERIRQSIMGDHCLANAASNIKVSTSDGVVTLRGTLNNEQEKIALLRKVKQTRGVHGVEDKLSLKSESISMTESIKSKASSAAGTVASAVENLTENDEEFAISERVRQAINEDPAYASVKRNIKVSTSEGVVTLRGSVNNESEKNALLRKVKQIRGVLSVDDRISTGR